MPETLTWYLGPSGPYASGGKIADDPVIAGPPGTLDNYWYNEQGGVWVPKTPEEKDAEHSDRANAALDADKRIRAMEMLIADLHGLTVGEVRSQLLAHYKGL